MLNDPSITALAVVIREGSFERAGASLGITPSAVWERVRGLEARLGAILVERGQRCVATDLGRKLCAHFDRVPLLDTISIRRSGAPLASRRRRPP